MRVQTAVQDIRSVRPANAGLFVIALAQLMVVLDIAIVNVALPSIQHALGLGPDGLEWVANAYAITFGGLLLLGGRAGDRFGRLRVFIAGVSIFTAGSLAGALTQTGSTLIAARALQGVGAAVMSPTALSLLADTFAEGTERNRALGVYSAISAGGGAIGLLLGGVLTTYLSWRWILFVNVPVGAFLVVAAPRVLRALPARPRRLDLPGAAAVTGGASLLAYGLSRAAVHGFDETITVASLIAAGVCLLAFLAIEATAKEPLMPLRIFGERNRSGALALSLAVGALLSGLLFLLTLFLQDVLGYSPLRTGFAFLPTALGVAAGARLTSLLIGRTGPLAPMALGSLMAAAALIWFAQLSVSADYPTQILPPLALLALGLGMVFVATTASVIAGVGPAESGLASALLNVGRQLGGSLGIAGMATLAASVTRSHLAEGPAHALTTGFDTAFKLGGFIALAGFGAVVILVRRRQPASDDTGKTAIVTGASRGIGQDIARRLSEAGYSLVVTGRSRAELESLAGELSDTVPVTADLTNPGDVEQLALVAENVLGHVDVLVNNAGGDTQLEFETMSWQENEAILRLNLQAPMQLTHRLLPGMLAGGCGHVVNISSIGGHVSFPYTEAYSAAKDGLIGFTRVFRGDYRARGVSASVLVLGAIRGGGQGQRTAEELGLPLPRAFTSTPDDVSTAVLRAIHRDMAEIVVMPGPGRLLKAMLDLFPGLGPALNRVSGTAITMQRVVEHRARARQTAA